MSRLSRRLGVVVAVVLIAGLAVATWVSRDDAGRPQSETADPVDVQPRAPSSGGDEPVEVSGDPRYSPQFTVRRPEGWREQPAAIAGDTVELYLARDLGEAGVARFTVNRVAGAPTASPAEVIVGTVEILREQGFAVRRVGTTTELEIAGEEGTAFDLDQSDPEVREFREIIFTHVDPQVGAQSFTVALNAPGRGNREQLLDDFRALADSFRFVP